VRIRFTPSARVAFLAAIATIRCDDPGAARRFRRRSEQVLRRLERFAESGRRLPELPDLPHLEIIVQPDRFFYRTRGRTVWIVAVWHDAQRAEAPGEQSCRLTPMMQLLRSALDRSDGEAICARRPRPFIAGQARRRGSGLVSPPMSERTGERGDGSASPNGGEGALDALRERLEAYVGQPMGEASVAPDPVNVPMIRHWVDALDDRNPVYLDEERAARTRFGGIVAPPAMLQAWSMPRPTIEGIAERGGAPSEMKSDNPLVALDAAGYTGTLATNSELEFVRYLRPGDRLQTCSEVDAISARKRTSLGLGYFVTWVTTYAAADGEIVGRQLFRVFKFDPSTIGGGS